MSTAVLEKLDDFFSEHKLLLYQKGELIIREDDEPSGVFYVKSGFVRMGSIFANGGELTLNIFKPGSFFPMMWAIGEVKTPYFYQTMSEVTVHKAPRHEVIEFLKINQDVLFNLTKRILIGMDGLLANVQYLLFGSSPNRVAAVILLLAKRFGEKISDKRIKINIELTHQDIANLAGVVRETASIAIEQFQKRGIIDHMKKTFIINNMEKLEKEIFVVASHPDTPATI